MNSTHYINYIIILIALFFTFKAGDSSSDVCYQCASTSRDSDCASNPTSAIIKNCSLGLAGFKNYYCVTQTIEQRGEIIAIIRECTTDAGLGVKWCQLDETPMTGFAIKCTFICSHDLCNELPIGRSQVKDASCNKGVVKGTGWPQYLMLIVILIVCVLPVI